MARKADIYYRAKTCIHGLYVTDNGGLYVKEGCHHPNIINLPVRERTGKVTRRPYLMAKNCNSCSEYKKAERKATVKDVAKAKEVVKPKRVAKKNTNKGRKVKIS